jgi:uncharacterized membrane protein
MIHQISTPLNAPFHKATVFFSLLNLFLAVFPPEDQRNDQRNFLLFLIFLDFFANDWVILNQDDCMKDTDFGSKGFWIKIIKLRQRGNR